MRNPILAVACAALLAVGCATATVQSPATAPLAADQATEVPATPAAAPAEAQLALGEQVFERACTACHTLEPPYRLAPPMTHIARHYRQAFAADRAAAVAHLKAFVRAPSAERSKMPAHAIERFGLMPPLDLPDDQLHAVALYVLNLPEPAPRSH